MNVKTYNESVWKEKLSLPQYASLDSRWRSRWEFARKQIANGSLVLDAGCGDGILGNFLIKEQSCEVYGLDVSDYALDLAAARGLQVCSCDISCDEFPFADKMFDAVVFTCSLEHITFPEYSIAQAKRVLKNGGKIIVTLPNAANIRIRLKIMNGEIPEDLLHSKPGEGMHFRFFNYKDEFEKNVVNVVGGLRTIKKEATLKNPKGHSALNRFIMNSLIKIRPNVFGEYSQFVLQKIDD